MFSDLNPKTAAAVPSRSGDLEGVSRFSKVWEGLRLYQYSWHLTFLDVLHKYFFILVLVVLFCDMENERNTTSNKWVLELVDHRTM